jgi:hypothetical protein
MNKITKNGKQFIGYKYKQVTAPIDKANMLIDSYKNFGWELDDELHSLGKQRIVTLIFKQDRKILNKMELTRLERHFEACIEEIDTLERSKTSSATAISLSVGILGTAFMAGSVFAVTNDPPLIFLCVLLAIPGFAGWISASHIYNVFLERSAKKIDPLIEEKHDEIYDICQKGFNLIN